MKAKLLLLFTFCPIVIICYLYSFQKSQVNPSFGFERKFYRLADSIVDKIKLSEKSEPSSFKIYNDNYYVYSIKNKDFRRISRTGSVEVFSSANSKIDMNLILYFKIDSSEIIALDQRSKKLFVYNTENGEQIIQDLPSFDRGFIISDSTLILTSIDSKSKDRIFFRYNTLTHQSVIIETTLPKVGDMGFSSDGFFEYSTDSNLLIYVLYGKGRYLLFDKELKSVESSNTIDQFRFNPFVIQKGSKFFLSRRSVSINSLAALNKKYIFIISMARSLKDKKNGLDGNIIDVYSNTYPHEYKGSIFLDKEVIGNIKNFQVDNNYMYFMNSEEIIKMCLPKSINQYNKNYFHDKYLK